MPFPTYFSHIVVVSAPIHAFLEFFLPLLHTIFCPSHWLLYSIAIVETMNSCERGMNPVTMTIIHPWKEYWQSRGLNQRPSVLKWCMLLTELKVSAKFNPFPNKPWFSCVCSTSLLKTLWEKEKLLVRAISPFPTAFSTLSTIFSYFKIVVSKLFQFGRVQNLSFGKGLIEILLK